MSWSSINPVSMGQEIGQKIADSLKKDFNPEEIKSRSPSEQQMKEIVSSLGQISRTAGQEFDKKDIQKNPEELQKFIFQNLLSTMELFCENVMKQPSTPYIEVGVAEAAFTSAKEAKPIVATDSLATCIGVAIYDPDNKWGGVIHFSHPDELENSKDELKKEILSRNPSSLQLHFRGGIKGQSVQLFEKVKNWTESFSDFTNVEVVSSSVMKHEYFDKNGNPNMMSLSLDTRNGKVEEYDRKDNPYAEERKQIDSQDQLEGKLLNQTFGNIDKQRKIKIIYS